MFSCINSLTSRRVSTSTTPTPTPAPIQTTSQASTTDLQSTQPSQNMGIPSPSPNPMTNMSQAMPPPPMTSISAQHERLILELLPFKDASKFKEWLHGDFVQGSWAEFWRDLVTKARTSYPEPDKTKTAEAAKNAINSRSIRFLVYHPDKTNWTAEDHHVRFIVTVIQDNMLKSLWSDSDWKKRALEVCKAVFEVLCYLKASCYAVESGGPPSYSQ